MSTVQEQDLEAYYQQIVDENAHLTFKATYDPDDDKLRLRSWNADGEPVPFSVGLRSLLKGRPYNFRWAPRQKLWRAHWSPEAEDALLIVADAIEEEDTTLADRAYERYDRFTGYLLDRTEEAVDSSSQIETGAIGANTSAKAEKISRKREQQKRKAANLWSKSDYWTWRSKAVLKHNRMKDRPDVRGRRIETLRADRRRMARSMEYDDGNIEERTKRWHDHFEMRIAYEEAVLAAQLGSDKPVGEYPWDLQPGGQIFIENGRRGFSEWLTIIRITKTSEGKPSRIYTTESQNEPSVKNVSWGAYDFKNYRPPSEEEAVKAKKTAKQPPLCNYNDRESVPVENMYYPGKFDDYPLKEMTKAEYGRIRRDYKGTRLIDGTHRVRVAVLSGSRYYIYLKDQKAKPAPKASEIPEPPKPSSVVALHRDGESLNLEDLDERQQKARTLRTEHRPDSMKKIDREDSVVVADELFPTPKTVAEKMFSHVADMENRKQLRFADFSAGSGAIVEYIISRGVKHIVAVDVSQEAVRHLTSYSAQVSESGVDLHVICADFLEMDPNEYEGFDAILINPPFGGAADIKHAKHARKFLKPDGRLVVVSAAGPRQVKYFEEHADCVEKLPAGSFMHAGTKVQTMMSLLTAE